MEKPRPVIERSPANRGRRIEASPEQAEVEPRTPIVIPSFIRFIGRLLWSAIKWVAPFAVVYGLVWYFFGETTVTATLDDKTVKAQVWIDGDFVGDTPYTTRLGFGRFEINVLPPEGSDTNESEQRATLWSVVIGQKVPADFTSIDEK